MRVRGPWDSNSTADRAGLDIQWVVGRWQGPPEPWVAALDGGLKPWVVVGGMELDQVMVVVGGGVVRSTASTRGVFGTQLDGNTTTDYTIRQMDVTSFPLIACMSTSIAAWFETRGPRTSRRIVMELQAADADPCAICLDDVGRGQTIFTAECSHVFHHRCISDSVAFGHRDCPLCKAAWRDLPATAVTRPSSPGPFDDDEPVVEQGYVEAPDHPVVALKTHCERPAVARDASMGSFAVLVHAVAPGVVAGTQRAPLDLVTAIDLSASMRGNKLRLVKQAVCFVIDSLGPTDRLSLVAFSNDASRVVRLARMTPDGQASARRAVDASPRAAAPTSARASAWPPGCSTTAASSSSRTGVMGTYSIGTSISRVPVHAFGFGADHDAAAMHAVAEETRGTFSFVENQAAIQDSFAQCIGGLLSVAMQNARIAMTCVHPGVRVLGIKSGRYENRVETDRRAASVDVGELYADEERRFLVFVRVPTAQATEEVTRLMKVWCLYDDVVTGCSEAVAGEDAVVLRPWEVAEGDDAQVSMEVERERVRVTATEDMAAARAAAERGEHAEAARILESGKEAVWWSAPGMAGDPTCSVLEEELSDLGARVASRREYEQTGRAAMLAGMNSHRQQRALSVAVRATHFGSSGRGGGAGRGGRAAPRPGSNVYIVVAGAAGEEDAFTIPRPPRFPSSLISLPCFRSPHTTSPQNPNPFHPEGFPSATRATDRAPQPLRAAGGRRRLPGRVILRALATRLCMRFPARHVVAEKVPRELVGVEEPLPAAEVEAEEQQRDEREKSMGASARRASRSGSQIFRTPASAMYSDDEPINLQSETAVDGGRDGNENETPASLEITTDTEFPAVQESVAQESFAILIHLKAPHAPASMDTRAPLDLVTVLDVSGSMVGMKLELMKRAMAFVIQNLRPSDRLSVIAFSSAAWRLFPLRKMTPFGQEQSLQSVESLVANGGTNIADGLWKASRVMEDRQARNPVSSIIILSDGVDTQNIPRLARIGGLPDYGQLVPSSILPGSGHHVPIHAFGFGLDHDSRAMHAVAELSGGTFSFIDAVGSIQDAFAQCIGGLLSVMAQETRLNIECADEGVLLTSIKSGGYVSGVDADGRRGFVDVGRLYADEEMDFLATVHVPAARGDTELIRARCAYRDAVTYDIVRVGGDPAVVTVARPAGAVTAAMSVQVEREWHRVHATEDMAAAQAAAEEHDYERAATILQSRRLDLESRVSLSSDRQTQALVAELGEMQRRVLNYQRYQESGRAYMLSGMSSHSFQRATARGDSTEIRGLVHSYQTPSMVDMLHRSQALLPEVVASQQLLNRSPTIAPSSRNPPPPVDDQVLRRQVIIVIHQQARQMATATGPVGHGGGEARVGVLEAAAECGWLVQGKEATPRGVIWSRNQSSSRYPSLQLLRREVRPANRRSKRPSSSGASTGAAPPCARFPPVFSASLRRALGVEGIAGMSRMGLTSFLH
ncbi:hypothetical protein HU200_022174 [Digitaria exilis]|uniref:Uncharacterized protein n=1 Tax=Digitaria exilis TaxID=1010633 RepID=A0A835CDH5_9POAL|nr:hypothetical protein HU200_022174 [Digitaria exilis]